MEQAVTCCHVTHTPAWGAPLLVPGGWLGSRPCPVLDTLLSKDATGRTCLTRML